MHACPDCFFKSFFDELASQLMLLSTEEEDDDDKDKLSTL